MTNRQIITMFLKATSDRTDRISSDSMWSKRLIFAFLRVFKNAITVEKFQKREINKANLITIPCIKMLEIDQNECPCAPASGFLFTKSEFPVPKSLMDKYHLVSTILGNKTIDYVRWDLIKYKLESRFERDRTTAFYTLKNINSKVHLYVYNSRVEHITIIDPFENDLLAFSYPDCEGNVKNVCSPLDQNFIIDEDLIPRIFDLTYDKLIKWKVGAPVDVLNNEMPDSATQSLK